VDDKLSRFKPPVPALRVLNGTEIVRERTVEANRMGRHDEDLAKAFVAGALAGVFASFLMEQFQSAWKNVSEELNARPKSSTPQDEPSTVKVAQAISKGLINEEIRKENRAAAGESVHYIMGGISGALYGMAAEVTPLATAGDGVAFGTSVWMAADNAVVPALGLAKPPTETPWSTHIYALSSHLVYGVVTETVRRALRTVVLH
jgi:putative membrane protein